jgi:CheY-like chemotaxis protein
VSTAIGDTGANLDSTPKSQPPKRRRIPATARIPIIALTAHAMSEDVNRANEVRMDGYETKPLEYERLMRKIATFVHG